MINFGDMDLYYGYTSSHYFENKNYEFIELTSIMEIDDSGSRGTVVGDIDNNGYADILKWRYYFNTSYPHLLLLNQGNHHSTDDRRDDTCNIHDLSNLLHQYNHKIKLA